MNTSAPQREPLFRAFSLILGLVFFALSSFALITLLVNVFPLLPLASRILLPAKSLLAVYGYSSFLIPVFLLHASILLLIPGWHPRSVIMFAGNIPVFFTVVGLERFFFFSRATIGSPLVSRIVSAGILVSALLAVLVEYILFLQLSDALVRTSPSADETKFDGVSEIEDDSVKGDSVKAEVDNVEVDTEDEQDFESHSVVADVDDSPRENTPRENTPRVNTLTIADAEEAAREDALRDDAPGDDAQGDDAPVDPDWPASVSAAPAPALAEKHSQVPEYVDFEKMRAPFDLPEIETWVENEEEPAVQEVPVSATSDVPIASDELVTSDVPMASDLPVQVRETDATISEIDISFDDSPIDDSPIDYEDMDDVPEYEIEDELDEEIDDIEDEIEEEIVEQEIPLPQIEESSKPPSFLATAREKRRGAYSVPFDILTSYPDGEYWVIDDATRRAAILLKETLNEFRIQADVTGIRKGPVITMFEILPAPGVKLSKIVGLQDNIALRLAASSVRIVAPIPGKHAVGIEVPNLRRAIVSFRELIETETPASKKMEIPVILGKDITGEAQLLDLAATPHLLIAGSTGSGKSVCVNSIILSILYKRSPDEVKLILIDPKIVELKLYNDIGHLLSPVITEPKRAFQSLQYCLCEMERRYALLDGMGVRDIKSYNKRIIERRIATEKIPYLVVIIDEFADLMATTGKELESTVARLCAMSRAVGIHLVLATQRPSIDVITGLIKANIPTRIAFMVASKMDSRIIIDQVGAEKLLGRGDMLYASATDPFPVRIQGAFVSEEEVERVVEHVKTLGEPEYIDDEIFVEDDEDEVLDASLFGDGEDPLYDKALEIVLLAGKASASYIQRKLKIGYNRAARLVEDMEARGIVGPANGSKPRDVVHHP